MSELNFIWPAIWARSSTGDWLFLLTTLHSLSFSLSPPFKRAKCSPTPRQSKISKIFSESIPPDPLTSLFLYYGPHAPLPPPLPRKILATRLCFFSFGLNYLRSEFPASNVLHSTNSKYLAPDCQILQYCWGTEYTEPLWTLERAKLEKQVLRSQRYRLQMCIFFFLIASKREKTPSKWQQNKRTCSVLVCQTPPTCHLIRNTRRDFRAKKNANYRRSDFLQVVQVDSPSGVDPEISERGGRKPNSRKGGGQNLTFQCRFPSFS